jgi:nucleoprotein TPR
MAAAVDTGFIAASYSVPESEINTLLEAPTVDLVKSLLAQIEKKAGEYQKKDAQTLRVEVELDTVVRSSENRAKQHKEALDKALKEAEALRSKLSQAGTCLAYSVL